MNKIQFNKLHFNAPENWLEVPMDKRMGLYLILNDNINFSLAEKIDIHLILIRSFMYLTGITQDMMDEWRKSLDDDTVFESCLADLANLVFWLIDEIKNDKEGAPIQYSISLTMYGCPVDRIKVYDQDGTPLYLFPPIDGMGNVTFGELLKIFSCVEALHGDGDRLEADPGQYNELIASIYRPINKEASEIALDKRLPLVGFDHLVEERKSYMWQVHDTTKEMIMFWAQCVRQKYVEAYSNLFQAAKSEGERVGNDYGWAGLIMALAKDLTQLKEVQNQNCEDAFVYLSYLEDERKRQEAEYERQKNKNGNH